MRKRLRKKLHLKEFQRLDFRVRIICAPSTVQADEDALIDGLIDFILTRDLCLFGAWSAKSPDRQLFISRGDRRQCTEEDRAAVRAWLQMRDDVVSFDVHPLFDGYHKDLLPYRQTTTLGR